MAQNVWRASAEPEILFQGHWNNEKSPHSLAFSHLPGADHASVGLGGDGGALSGRSHGTQLGDTAPRAEGWGEQGGCQTWRCPIFVVNFAKDDIQRILKGHVGVQICVSESV